MTGAEADRCDVLVVGAGGAGLRAAIAAYDANPHLDILLINKGPIGATGTTALAYSDRMAFHATLPHTEPGGPDAWKYHARDIYEIGGRVSDGDLAVILAQRSQDAFEYLDALGVPFVKDSDGRARQFVTDGSEYARACYTGPDTASQIEKALLRRLGETHVRARDDLMLADLAVGPHGVAGAVAIRTSDDEVVPIAAKAVVLATGGPGSIYDNTVFPPGMTGDGHAAAYRAGAELVNMEFIQIGLCEYHTGLACSGSIMRCVPRFVNHAGEEILPRYCPGLSAAEIANIIFAKGASWPVSAEKPSRVVDIAVAGEIARGQEAFLDFSQNPAGFEWQQLAAEHQARFQAEAGGQVAPGVTPLGRLLRINPAVVDWLHRRLIKLQAGERMGVLPKVQHFQGGIKIDRNAATTVRGLFACGECAGGQHGANRPGGNALLDTQVFGQIAGEAAARGAASHKVLDESVSRDVARALVSGRASEAIAARKGRGVDARQVSRHVRWVLSGAASVVRTEDGLAAALRRIEVHRARHMADGNNGWLEARNALVVAEMILRAALMRDESRGPHLRFSSPDDLELIPSRPGWERYIVLRRADDGSMTLEARQPASLPFVM